MSAQGVGLAIALGLFAGAGAARGVPLDAHVSAGVGPETPPAATLTLRIGPGDTLVRALLRAGVDRRQAYGAAAALDDLFDSREIRAGDRVVLQVEQMAGTPALHLRSLHLATGRHQDLTIVARNGGGFSTSGPRTTRRERRTVLNRSGTVSGDFRAALAAAGVPGGVAEEVLTAFSSDPDLPDQPEPGSDFTVVFEPAGRGRAAQAAQLRYASLRSDGMEHRVYRYTLGRREVAFVEPSGRGVVPLRLAPPVGEARVTSPWGWRIHPVLGVAKFHNGVDFGAPVGTPVRAAADGVIEDRGWRGNYGRYVRIRHSARLETAYAHLSRFARGLHPGSHVRRGAIVAYVGTSGMATGPHLYYEVLIDGERVDPEQANLAMPIQLTGSSLSHFNAYMAEVASSLPR